MPFELQTAFFITNHSHLYFLLDPRDYHRQYCNNYSLHLHFQHFPFHHLTQSPEYLNLYPFLQFQNRVHFFRWRYFDQLSVSFLKAHLGQYLLLIYLDGKCPHLEDSSKNRAL